MMEDLVNDTIDALHQSELLNDTIDALHQSEITDSAFPSWLCSPSPPQQVDNFPPYRLGSFVTDISATKDWSSPNRSRDVVKGASSQNKEECGDVVLGSSSQKDEDVDNTIVEVPPSPVLLSANRSRKRGCGQ